MPEEEKVYCSMYSRNAEIYHHGIKGQKWGVENGPPYPLNDNIKAITLGHLSKENNYDKLAYETVRTEIDMSDNIYKAKDFDIEVAKRDEPSRIISI